MDGCSSSPSLLPREAKKDLCTVRARWQVLTGDGFCCRFSASFQFNTLLLSDDSSSFNNKYAYAWSSISRALKLWRYFWDSGDFVVWRQKIEFPRWGGQACRRACVSRLSKYLRRDGWWGFFLFVSSPHTLLAAFREIKRQSVSSVDWLSFGSVLR